MTTRFAIAIVLVCGCKNDASQAAPVASASASASVASASASASATPAAGPTTYAGSYTATIGTLYVPDAAAWDGVKFRGDDGGVGALGEGSITITNDADAGTLTGEIRGPARSRDAHGRRSRQVHHVPRRTTQRDRHGLQRNRHRDHRGERDQRRDARLVVARERAPRRYVRGEAEVNAGRVTTTDTPARMNAAATTSRDVTG